MNDMLGFFTQSKEKIISYLKRYLDSKQQRVAVVDSQWTSRTFSELGEFATRGKMIRGSLVLLGASLLGKKTDSHTLALASAIEIMHSSLLVHDDIMDKDDMRRGRATMHKQFAERGRKQHLSDPEHFGISSAICAGDVGFFLASDLIDQAFQKRRKAAKEIRDTFSSEVMKVGVAQIVEIRESMRQVAPSPQTILRIYKHKTARYTFSLPLLMGAKYAGASKVLQGYLEKFGEAVGVLFQIQDDYIGLFGDPKKTGKAIGTDIVGGKKTFYYTLLFEKATSSERKRLQQYMKKKTLTKKDIAFVREALEKYGIIRQVETMKQRLEKTAYKHVHHMHISARYKQIFEQLIAYNSRRMA